MNNQVHKEKRMRTKTKLVERDPKILQMLKLLDTDFKQSCLYLKKSSYKFPHKIGNYIKDTGRAQLLMTD